MVVYRKRFHRVLAVLLGNLGLDNLIMFYDANDIQLSTKTEVVTCEDTAKKYEAWGWFVQKIDGNDVDQIREAIKKAQAEKERPSLIIGHCIMGRVLVRLTTHLTRATALLTVLLWVAMLTSTP